MIRYYNLKGIIMKKIIDYTCPYCGHNKARYDKNDFGEWADCLNCGERVFRKRIKEFEEYFINNSPPKPKVRCPYCNSFDTKKITATSKAANVFFFGIFAIGKTTKEWHCNNCKSDF